MTRPDPVRQMLRARGAGRQVVDGGLEYLANRWRQAVADVERGYPLGMDDYLNDMDTRQLLHEALLVATDRQKRLLAPELAGLDQRFRAATRPSDTCIWGGDTKARGWSPAVNWWYYRLPQGRQKLA